MKNRQLHAAFEEWRDRYLEAKVDLRDSGWRSSDQNLQSFAWTREALDPPPSQPASDRRVSSSRFDTLLGSQQKAWSPAEDPLSKIKRLKELLDIGALTHEQFASKRDELLARVHFLRVRATAVLIL